VAKKKTANKAPAKRPNDNTKKPRVDICFLAEDGNKNNPFIENNVQIETLFKKALEIFKQKHDERKNGIMPTLADIQLLNGHQVERWIQAEFAAIFNTILRKNEANYFAETEVSKSSLGGTGWKPLAAIEMKWFLYGEQSVQQKIQSAIKQIKNWRGKNRPEIPLYVFIWSIGFKEGKEGISPEEAKNSYIAVIETIGEENIVFQSGNSRENPLLGQASALNFGGKTYSTSSHIIVGRVSDETQKNTAAKKKAT
jgi:hypothetical protein